MWYQITVNIYVLQDCLFVYLISMKYCFCASLENVWALRITLFMPVVTKK